ncbi:MAG: hypothetical protein V7L27_29305 [Nostoc sp.]
MIKHELDNIIELTSLLSKVYINTIQIIEIPHKLAKQFSQLPIPIWLRSHQRERQESNLRSVAG